jgi:hypothetical protein
LPSKPTTVKQLDEWRNADIEIETLEFKEAKNQFGFRDLLCYCVAIANERGGKLLLGISNKPPRQVVGTKAYPAVGKLKKELLDKLHFRVDVEEVQHPDGRVLVFHIPSRPTGHPYHLDGAYFMRSGESLVPMTTDQLQQIIEEEMSPLAKRMLYMIVAIGVFTLLLLIYLGTEHLWRTETQPSANKTVDERAGSAKTPERQQQEQSAIKAPALKTPKLRKALVVERVDWHDKHNWRKYLKVGMTKAEVEQLFGEAEKVRVSSDFEYWNYGSGEIDFYQGGLYSWDEPDR